MQAIWSYKTLNILFFSKSSVYLPGRVGGAETSIRLMAEQMISRKHNVTYFTYADNPDRQASIINGVEVHFYSQPKYKRKYFIKKKPLKKKDKAEHLENEIEKLIDAKSIDLVYAHYDRYTLRAFLNVRKRRPFKLVLRMAGLKWYEEGKKSDEVKLDYQSIFNAVDSINYNTPGLLDITHQFAEKIDMDLQPKDEYVADIGAKAVGKKRVESNESKQILNVVVATRFSSYQKRQDILVKAIALLKRDVELDLLMIGTGPERERIQAMVDEYGLSSQIAIEEFLTQDELWERLQCADLLCHPCDYEGLSKIIIESMMLGVPVLASNVIPLSDYIENDVTGVLANNTPEDWAAAIKRLARDRSSLLKLGDNARAYTLERFDVQKNAETCEKEFLRLINL